MAVEGLREPGSRHWHFFAVAREAAIHTDDQEAVRQMLRSIPLNGFSDSKHSEVETDIRSLVRDIYKKKRETGIAGLFSGCPLGDKHSPERTSAARERSELRKVRAPFCKEHCPQPCAILAPLIRPEGTPFAQVWASSIWRGSQGKAGATGGLGAGARHTYGRCIDLALGRPGERIQITGRHTEVKDAGSVKKSVERHLASLCQAGLLEKEPGRAGYYTLPLVTAEQLAQLESQGTRQHHENAKHRTESEWQSNREAKRKWKEAELAKSREKKEAARAKARGLHPIRPNRQSANSHLSSRLGSGRR